MIFDHVSIGVSDGERAKAFFTKALAPLGIGLVMEFEGWIGFGRDGKPELWLVTKWATPGPLHLAFKCETHAQVDAFHTAALAAGGKDNGAPGIREHYHPTYYGAFVYGPDGHNIEAVCHKPV
jgi:catechol 2,3-dioxygenase-like lactoylglutathione lyase family enzyme